eukprot:SAG25_NODE_11646_length_299_cov_0.965000_1_plen_61_part_10
MEAPAVRAQIESLYAQHNPSKLADVDSLCAKYGAERLLKMLRKKYVDGEQQQQQSEPEPEP